MSLNCGVGEDSRVPWTARRSNQSILKEISPEYSLEGLMLKLKLQYFGHLMWRPDSLEETLMLGRLKTGGEGDDRGWDSWVASPTQWTWASSVSWWWTGKPGVLQSMGSQRVEHNWAIELNWTDLIWPLQLTIQREKDYLFPESLSRCPREDAGYSHLGHCHCWTIHSGQENKKLWSVTFRWVICPHLQWRMLCSVMSGCVQPPGL